MKQNRKHIGVLLFLLLSCCVLHAQRFVNTSLDGAQTVCAILQDEQGMMWLGTENGLYSYDGYHSHRHYADRTASNSRVNALGLKGHTLYMATGNGLLAFDLNTYSYQPVPSRRDAAGQSVRSATEQRVVDTQQAHSNYGSEVYALLHTPEGLLMGTISGLFRLTNQGRDKTPILLREGAQPLVNALAYDAVRRCYWIGTEGALYRADVHLKTFTKIPALDGNSIKCLAEETNGTLYIGTDNGLYSMALDQSVTHDVHDSRDASTIPNNIVWSCFVDQWQNVWIGTDNGLSRLSTHTYYRYTALDKVTLSGEGNCLHELCQTRDGTWWLGGTNGLIRQGKAWYRQNNVQYPLSHNRVRKIYEDSDGDVWVCTDHGINLLDRTTQQMRNFIVRDATDTYSTAWAYDVLEDRQGRMWMASYMGGVFVVDKKRLLADIARQTATTVSVVADVHFSDQGHRALSGLHVGQLAMDGQGMVWASTFNGLDCINPKTLEVTRMEYNSAVNYLMADAKGNVWVGGNGQVKCFFRDKRGKQPTADSKTWNVGGKTVTMCDVAGKTWVVTGMECCVIDLSGKSFRFRIPSPVAPLAIFWSKAQHEVVMGGNDGYVSLRDDVSVQAGAETLLMPTDILVNGTPWQGTADGQETRSIKTAPRNLQELVLKSDENNFTLQLTDLPFSGRPSAVYAYRLEGSDHDWHYLNQGHLDIVYNGLPPGDYRLAVHAVDGEGGIGNEVYALEVTILPPWYLSVWAKLVYLLLAVALAWGVFKFCLVRSRLADERRQKAEILEQVDARMSFFNRLSEDLKAAVRHGSFDEITELANRCLGITPDHVEVDGTALSEADQRLLKEITETIETHMIDSDFNVTTLQETMGIGSKQLYRKLKALTGKTPVEYIRELRMQKASQMLREGKFSVSEVMYTVGFSNSSYFSKCFSKTFGMLPTEYMKSKKRPEIKTGLALVLMLFMTLPAMAQTIVSKPVPFSYDLTSNEIWNFSQDQEGYVWVATSGGVARYDGFRLTTFRNDYRHPSILSDNEATIVTDGGRYLWIGTRKGVTLVDKDDYRFFRPADRDLQTVDASEIVVQSQSVWVNGTANRVYRCNQEGRIVKRYDLRTCAGKKGAKVTVYNLYVDRNKKLWAMLGSSGMAWYDASHDRFVKVAVPQDINYFVMTQDRSGTYWIGTWGNGLYTYDPQKNALAKHTVTNPITGEEDTSFYSIVQDDVFGYLWFLSYQSLYTYRVEGGQFQPVNLTDVVQNHKMYTRIFKDREGNLWLSSYDNAFIISFDRSTIRNYTLPQLTDRYGWDANLLDIGVDDDGIVWLVQDRYGIFLYDRQTDRLEYPKNQSGSNKTLEKSRLPNAFWVNDVNSSTILLYQREGWKLRLVRQYKLSDADPQCGSVSQMLEDADGRLWVRSSRQKIFVCADGQIHRMAGNSSSSYILSDKSGSLWKISSNGNVSRLQFTNWIKERIVTTDSIYRKADFIHTACIDDIGRIWIVSTMGMVYQTDSEKKNLKAVDVDFLLDDCTPLQIMADKDNLWMVANKKIIQYNSQKKGYLVFSTLDDNIRVNIFRQHAAALDGHGVCLVGGHNGFVAIGKDYPDTRTRLEYEPRISELTLDNREMILPDHEQVVLSPDARNIEIHIAPLTYGLVQKPRIAYQLEGVDRDWVYLSPERHSALYNRLDDGTYRMRIKYEYEPGRWSESKILLTLIQQPSWYETWWAYVIYTLLVLGIAYLLLTTPFEMSKLRKRVDELMQKRQHQQMVLEKVPDIAPVSNEDETFLHHIIEEIENHLTESEYDLAALASSMNVSKSTLNRKVKALTDMTPSDFIYSIRMKRASQMLLNTQRPVSEIAYLVGFSTPKYFTKCFKKEFGCTPSEYKQQRN